MDLMVEDSKAWFEIYEVAIAAYEENDKYLTVKLLDIDPKTGKFKLSRKVLLPRPERQDRPTFPTHPR